MTATDPQQVRAFVAIQVLGLCSALDEGVVSAQQARNWLFRTGMLERLKDAGACDGCLGVVQTGAELCDESMTCEEQLHALRGRALDILRVVNGA